MKERLERNSRQQGWDYDMNYIRKSKRRRPEYPQTIALICATMSFPVLTGATLVYILSLIAHLNL